MDAAAEKEIVRRYFSKARQDRALYRPYAIRTAPD